jgi:hypothetical protein
MAITTPDRSAMPTTVLTAAGVALELTFLDFIGTSQMLAPPVAGTVRGSTSMAIAGWKRRCG